MPSTTTHAPAQPPSKRSSSYKEEDQKTLEALNKSVDAIRALTAPDPYILTIPQDVEPRYHHSYQAQAMQWLHETPFRYKEGEMTQYQTFIYHEHGNGMYVLQSSRPSDEGSDSAKAGLNGGTPKEAGAPKKKISLNAYKKAKTGTGTPVTGTEAKLENAPPVKQGAVKGPVERVKVETDQVLAAVAEIEDVVPEAEKKDLKRKREDSVNVQSDRHENHDAPAMKKARSSTIDRANARSKPSREHPDTQQIAKLDGTSTPALSQVHSEDTGLPPRLSPLEVEPLPSRLSPTIPANIAATLEAREQFRSASDETLTTVSASKKDQLTPIRKSDGGITKRKSPVPKNAFRANSSSPAVRSDTDEKVATRPTVTSAPQRSAQRARSPELCHDDELAINQALKKKRGLVVKMKYKKAQREGIKRILNLRPQPDKVKKSTSPPPKQPTEGPSHAETPIEKHTKTAGHDRKDGSGKGVAQKIAPVTQSKVDTGAKKKLPEASEKHSTKAEPRLSSSQTHTTDSSEQKRKKIPEPIDSGKARDPSTPVPSDILSPSLLSSSQKSQQVTPGMATVTSSTKSHLLPAAVAMQRERSTESSIMAVDSPSAASTSTPIPKSDQHATANNATRSSGNGAPFSNPRRPPKHPVWEARQKRLENLGRDLKHAASAHLTAKEPKLAAIKSVESLIAYILAFTCCDESNFQSTPKQPPEPRTWRSLSGFFNFVKHNTKPHPLLFGLACGLGMVFNAHILDLCALHPAEGVGREGLLETWALLQKCAGEAAGKLGGVESLRAAFPKAWKARSSKADETFNEALDPATDSFAGPFDLPLGVHTPAVKAARAGYSMLQEWIEREKIEYELQLKL